MKYSLNLIQKHIQEKLPEPNVLQDIIIFHAFEVESVENINNDNIFDIKVLPDRAGDCLSHYGMAREIAGLLNLNLKEISELSLPELPLKMPIEIKTDKCLRYMAIEINNLNIGPSPKWLKDLLESIGQRSINNVVDATNYVLQDIGQPVHAFDIEKIDGGITIREAHDDETIITLSNEDKKLTNDMVVISDYVGSLAIAGVKGGKTAEVDNNTKSILIEVANFQSTNIRKTSRSLNLVTDASKRYENNLSPAVIDDAAKEVVNLILEIAGGNVVGVRDEYIKPQDKKIINFKREDISRFLGQVDQESISSVFDKYKYQYSYDDGVFTLNIPFWRQDINSIQDIVEEIGRVNGYENIKALPLPFTPNVSKNETFENIRRTKEYLINKGFSEVMNYTFVKKGDIYVKHGPKDKSALRTNLSDSLKESFDRNKLNAPLIGVEKIKIFEIGTVFSLGGDKPKEEIRVATVDNGAVLELSLLDFIKKNSIDVTSQVKQFKQKNESKFKNWSVYPFITRDIAVWVDDHESIEKLLSIFDNFAKDYCVIPPTKFDEFSKDGRVSLAYRFVFQSKNKTLTEDEVASWWEKLIEEIKESNSFEIR